MRQEPPQIKFNCHSVKRKYTTLPTQNCVLFDRLNTFSFVVPSTACCCARIAVAPTIACVHNSQITKTKCPVKRGRHFRNVLHPRPLQPLNGWQTGKSSFFETRILFEEMATVNSYSNMSPTAVIQHNDPCHSHCLRFAVKKINT